MLSSWYSLPKALHTDEVKPYYEALASRKVTLAIKRVLDIIVSGLLIVLTSPIMFVAACLVAAGKDGPIFYRQERVGQNLKTIRIFKFRSMVQNADKVGQLTVGEDDPRITKAGKILRQTRIDEFPQMFNVFVGDMSLVGTRPEVKRYVDQYTPEMMATLLLAPGISSRASIAFANENEILKGKDDTDAYYINYLLPEKMKINLDYLKHVSIFSDIAVLFNTIGCVFKKGGTAEPVAEK